MELPVIFLILILLAISTILLVITVAVSYLITQVGCIGTFGIVLLVFAMAGWLAWRVMKAN